jgi:membrane-bound serine protease (ClpP class)
LIVGLVGWEEIILLGVGMIAMGIEIFVVPGFGLAGIVAITCIGVATFMALLGAIPTWGDMARASGILIVAAGIVAVVLTVLLKYLPASSSGRGIFLRTATDRSAGYVADRIRDDLIGVVGVAVTDLRPSGTAQFDEERLDVVSDVGFVAKGSKIRVIRSEGYRHVVERADDLTDD